MSRFKMLLAAVLVLALVVLVLATGHVSAGDPDGGPHGIIHILM